MPINITLFRDFHEDQRTSMEVYADNLIENLQKLKQTKQTQFSFKAFQPAIGSFVHHFPNIANLKMRTARYLSYPQLAKKQQGNINHILDHGYAHLLSTLDARKTIITVHDIMPILVSRGIMPSVSGKRYQWLAEWSARYYRRAKKIIAISHSTKNDLIKYCHCDPARIEVIYYGINPAFQQFSTLKKTQLRKKFSLPENSQLILITGQEYYKNQLTSLRVFENLYQTSQKNIYLVRLGRQTPEWQAALQNCNMTDTIIQLDYLPAQDMPVLYNAVDYLLFPSWYEGFGWPPIEAMACGTPVITSNRASLPEAVGNAGLIAEPDDVETLTNHILRLMNNDAFKKEKIAQGLEHVKQFDWQKNAEQVSKIYQNLLK